MRLRVEHQTLRRLPRTGAIVFTIHVYLTPFSDLGPGEAGRLAAAIRGMKEEEVVSRCGVSLHCSMFGRLHRVDAFYISHRMQWNFEAAALEWLDGQHRDEVQRGLARE
jgi:hypothetical protein